MSDFYLENEVAKRLNRPPNKRCQTNKNNEKNNYYLFSTQIPRHRVT